MKKYSIIYADPPWDQKAGRKLSGYHVIDGKQVWHSDTKVSSDLPYPTMSVKDIANINVSAICEDNAFLFLWVTNKYLLEAKQVIEAWGFNYSTCITWKKKRMGGGLGGMVRITHEHLLFCKRGNLKATAVLPESVIEAKRPYVNGYPCHSKKPALFRDLIESVSVGSKRLEMFAREKVLGWDVWGNELINDVEIPLL